MHERWGSQGPLKRWLWCHSLLAFPLVYLGWAYLFWAPLLFSASSVWAFPNLFWFLLGGASPVVAGLGLAALVGGKAQLMLSGNVLLATLLVLAWRKELPRIPGRTT